MYLGLVILSVLAGLFSTVAVSLFVELSILEVLLTYGSTGCISMYLLMFMLYSREGNDEPFDLSTSANTHI